MNASKLARRSASLLGGEQVLAATKAIPRGSAHSAILGAAGAVVGGPVLDAAATGAGSEERDAAGVDTGKATQVLLVATPTRLAVVTLSALGRPKELAGALDRARIGSVSTGETSLFGQKMTEIVVTLADGRELGFGVAKVHRRDGDAVVAALQG